MTSNDADAITIQLRELISVNKEQIAEIKTLAAQMQRDNAEFRALMIKEFSNFKAEQNANFDAFKTEVRQDIKEIRQDVQELRAEVIVLQRDVEGIKHDVAALFHWDYWILTFIAAALVIPHLSEIMKTLIGAVAQGVSAVSSLFSKAKNQP